MESLSGILPYIQIGLSVLLMATILLQQSSAGLGGAFGGDNFSAGFHTKRGFEKTLFTTSIVIAVLFVISTLVALVIR